VEAIEQVVAEVVLLRGPGMDASERAIGEVRTRLALVEEATAELELLGGTSPSLDRLRRSLEAPAEEVPAPRDEDDPGGAPGTAEGRR
jgi:hypothetical protein